MCLCNNPSVCVSERTRERQMRKGNGEAKGGGGRGRGCYCERKYESVLRGEHDMHCAVMCARVTGWGCVRLCQTV